MGKPKSVRNRLRKKLEAKQRKEENVSLDELLQRAENSIDEYDYESAQRNLQKVMELDPDNVKALEFSATLLLEAGDVENAKRCLGRAVTVQPDTGYSKFFSLAQLFEGTESLSLYQRGIEILERGRQIDDDEEIRRNLSNSYNALAELYVTDLCDQDDAEERCKEAIENAIRIDSTNPEAFQMKARFLLVKEQFDEARSALNESLSLWLPKYQSILDNQADIGSFDPVETCPLSYNSRLTTSKICMELEQFDSATQVLEGMLEEDDTVVDTWYLLGWLNRLRAISLKDEDYNGNARYYLQKAKVAHAVNPTDDEQMLKHIDEILIELGSDLEDTEEDNNPENWEELETSDDEETNRMED